MSNKELASARSFWKRKELLAGRRSRYVEVQEVSFDSVAADAVENGLVDDVVAILGTGKEANVYLGLWKSSPLALKVYRLHSTPHRKKARMGYAPDIMGMMAAKEFTTLDKAYRAGVPVPTPARRADNMFTMRFLGENEKAPVLREVTLDEPEQVADQAVAIVEKLLGAFIIHGDLSEYNLVYHDGRLYVIDFPQALDLSSRVNRLAKFESGKALLLRDLKNLEKYFTRFGVVLDADGEYDRLSRWFESEHC
jgi:RIO kinase 1